jgi:hypothetical protein
LSGLCLQPMVSLEEYVSCCLSVCRSPFFAHCMLPEIMSPADCTPQSVTLRRLGLPRTVSPAVCVSRRLCLMDRRPRTVPPADPDSCRLCFTDTVSQHSRQDTWSDGETVGGRHIPCATQSARAVGVRQSARHPVPHAGVRGSQSSGGIFAGKSQAAHGPGHETRPPNRTDRHRRTMPREARGVS